MADIIEQILNNPGFWGAIILFIAYKLVGELNKGKLKPEQKPDFGVKVRAKRVEDHLKKREEHFSIRPKKAYLFRDVFKLGKIIKVEEIPQKFNGKDIMISSLKYQRPGLWDSIIGFFGFGYKRLLVDDKNIKKVFSDPDKQIHYIINKNIFFRERGGMLILSGEAEAKFIDEINADKDYENTKGFVSDFPRRLSNLSPGHAIHGDSLELESSLKDKAEEKKRHIWGR